MSKTNCRGIITNLMDNDMLFIVGQRWCGYTKKAVIAHAGVPVIYLDEFADAMRTIDWLQCSYKYTTVPMIFKGYKLLGGSEVICSA